MKRRRSFDENHQRKFLVVADETPEFDRALYYAARRASRTNGGLVILFVIDVQDFDDWMGVGNVMRAEAREEAQKRLDALSQRAQSVAAIAPEVVMREGGKAEEIVKLIEEDEDIAILALAASVNKEGPGPLVSTLIAGGLGAFPIPITLVPGALTDHELDALA